MFLYHNKNLTVQNMKAIWTSADKHMLAISFVLGLAFLAGNAVRWHYFVVTGGVVSTPLASTLSFLGGSLLSFITPGRAGEFGRGIFYQSGSMGTVALVTLAEKVYMTFFILAFGTIGAFLGQKKLETGLFLPYPLILVGLTVLSGLFLYVIIKGNKLRIRSLFNAFPTNDMDRFFLLTLTNIVYVIGIFQIWFIVLAFFKIKLITAFITLSVTLIVLTFIPITIGNMGIREACFIYVLGALENVPETIAFSAGILVFVQNILIPAILGIPVFLKR
ncbi:MAG: hypothetical protein A2268_02045 [Candidatus Raymondbacteria bacterium RifOxyA12_full_50_37]|nr:MAG: hypothetical protein A2268_02045 [Candidatus Raymondbacteria bacterium RifOxyA12_full_50_37]OGJ92210.1 MAG: hypothetical protein A2248_10875 [Candidatus Raymondbacteria bacterium RIFOXYA2_FULL_49_16]OGJ98536.1 MAG: hypothetical protein A2453_06675 [Candidatus Raymondbacteria bacterium RIFOXYC2_FULL_50_21]OGK06732.1 MAG: hypothetical protein A2487_03830 [Candidatus Raymondbacteria bacterium RifOxyC12_full_50_8]OGP44205.1 MAG: hypothetical protein A2324_06800 [Candidatus Raymondbacteria b